MKLLKQKLSKQKAQPRVFGYFLRKKVPAMPGMRAEKIAGEGEIII